MAQSPGFVFKIAILLLACLYLAACGPEETVQWSADGTQAAVVSGGSLYLCDAQGRLSDPLADEVERVSWLPDSSRLVVVSKRELATWDELVAAAPLGFEEKKIAAAALVARDEFYRYEGEMDDFRPSNAGVLTSGQWATAMLYLKTIADPGFKERFGDQWKEIEDLKVEIRAVRLIPAFPGEAANGIALFATLENVLELRVSPDGGALAVVTERGEGLDDGQVRSLSVFPSREGGKPVVVAEGVAEFPDWSADGRDMIYIRCETRDTGGTQLGRISRRTVRNAQGVILDNPSQALEIGVVIFRDTLRVRCLPDGRILFAAAEAALPTACNDFSDRLTLFFLDPGQGGSISRIIPRSADRRLPDRADLFEVSPDGKYAAVPGGKGRISRVTLTTGEIVAIVDKDGTGDLHTIPAWRNSQQLCLIAPSGSGYTASGRDEVLLWSEGQTSIVSQNWPDKVLEGIK